MLCECLLENLEKQYLKNAEAVGVDVASSFEGREGTSADVFHFRHLQLAVETQTEPHASHIPSREKRQKLYRHPYGSGEAWK